MFDEQCGMSVDDYLPSEKVISYAYTISVLSFVFFLVGMILLVIHDLYLVLSLRIEFLLYVLNSFLFIVSFRYGIKIYNYRKVKSIINKIKSNNFVDNDLKFLRAISLNVSRSSTIILYISILLFFLFYCFKAYRRAIEVQSSGIDIFSYEALLSSGDLVATAIVFSFIVTIPYFIRNYIILAEVIMKDRE